MLMLLLFGTGYLLVDVFMTNGSPSVGGPQPATLRAEVQPGAEAVESRLDAGSDIPQSPTPERKSQLAAPPEVEPSAPDFLAPRKPHHVPETVTDDLSLIEPELGWRSSSLEAAGHRVAATFAATTVAVPQEAGVEPVPQGRTLLGRDHPRLLPAGIGPAALRNAAASGDPDAAFEVATRFAEGKGVTQDLKQAFAWYQRAAAQGHASAQFRVAAFHERGIGVAADRERATLWYRRAAEQGHVKAMHNLAVLMVGKGGERADYAGAARWFREAAERGLADSQFNLAALCQDGHGVARSLADAYKWFALAARSGDRGAAQRQALLKARLDPGELAAAEQMVATWRVRDAGATVDAAGPASAGPDGAGE
jgi:TPR repeat protein